MQTSQPQSVLQAYRKVHKSLAGLCMRIKEQNTAGAWKPCSTLFPEVPTIFPHDLPFLWKTAEGQALSPTTLTLGWLTVSVRLEG